MMLFGAVHVFTVLCATADAACVACVGGTAGDCKGARYAVSSLLNVQLCFAICMHNLGMSNNKAKWFRH